MEFNEAKFRELVLYISDFSRKDHAWDTTMLTKQLFFCDFLSYRETRQPITGAQYIARFYGPMPRQLPTLTGQMITEGEITLRKGVLRETVIPHRKPDNSLFSNQEFLIIDRVLEALSDVTMDRVDGLEHRFLGWQAAISETRATGKATVIPYYTVFVQQTQHATPEEIQEVTEALQEYQRQNAVPTTTRNRIREIVPHALVKSLTNCEPMLTPKTYQQHLYLLQTLHGVPLGYPFGAREAGMTCDDAAQDLNLAKNRREVHIVYSRYKEAVRISPGQPPQESPADLELRPMYESQVEQLTQAFGEKHPRKLGLLAQLVSVWNQIKPKDDESIGEVTSLTAYLNPHLYGQEIEDAVKELRGRQLAGHGTAQQP